MNKKLGLAVAGALLAASASAQAGITIPAGDWTVDIGGNVNAFMVSTSGDLADDAAGKKVNGKNIRTGLLPSAVGIGAKTRQNDLDIAVQFTFFVGGDDNNSGNAGGSNSINIRQAYATFGDHSWGTVKFGRDLGIYGSDAILSDMTLLGVGVGANNAGGSSTLGRIGSGYQYADWNGQISYASPNWNGFSFAAGIRDPQNNGGTAANSNLTNNNKLGYEGKINYEWTGDVSGKVWLGAISQKMESNYASATDYTAHAVEVGGKVAVAGFGLVGHYYDGDNVGTGIQFQTEAKKTNDRGGYVQATYTIPTGTKLGLSWGTSKTEVKATNIETENRSWIVGAYHPLTKSLNLVAEYTDQKLKVDQAADKDGKIVSVGAILFF